MTDKDDDGFDIEPIAQVVIAEDYYPHVVFMEGVDTIALDQQWLYADYVDRRLWKFSPMTGKPLRPDLAEVEDEPRRLHEEVQQWQEKCNTYMELHDAVVADSDRLYAAVANLIRVKGRHNTELAYQRLIAAYDKVKEKNND